MLYLYYSNRQERLAAELASLPAPADPLVPELVLVQNQGMAQWLTQELAQRRGISANVEYLLPAEFGWRLYRQLRPELPTTDSAFAREVLLWRVMALLPTAWTIRCSRRWRATSPASCRPSAVTSSPSASPMSMTSTWSTAPIGCWPGRRARA